MADEQIVDENAADDSATATTEEDLRDLKYPKDDVETSDNEEDEPSEDTDTEDDSEEAGEEDGKTDDSQEEESEEEPPTFVKEFPHIKGDTPEEYARNLEKTKRESDTEGKRLYDENQELKRQLGLSGPPDVTPKVADVGETLEDEVELSPEALFMKQELNDRINKAYDAFSKKFPQVQNEAEYAKFSNEVATLSRTIQVSQKRFPSPEELYSKAAVILGWEPADAPPTPKDKLDNAVINTGATSKTTSGGKKGATKSKVTDQMVAANRLMYPNKSDAEIRAELEPYVN